MSFFYLLNQTPTPAGLPGMLPGATVYDDFNRANANSAGTSSSGHTWTNLYLTIGVTSNKGSAPNGQGIGVITTTLADCTIQVTAEVFAATTFARGGIIFRATDVNNLWQFVKGENNNRYELNKNVAGGLTTVQTYSTTPADGDILMVILAGNSIQCYLNGVLRLSTTDAFNNTAVKHGLQIFTNAHRFENFSIAP